MTGAIVVISWWANCPALRCLERLLPRRGDRPVFYVQVGKTAAQKARFRRLAPAPARELPYPAGAPADHSRVIDYVTRRALARQSGVLFIDHDVFLQGDLAGWLAGLRPEGDGQLLGVPAPAGRLSLTSPAFWLSPIRWPAGLSFDPIPFAPRPEARFPGLVWSDDPPRLPVRDTLCAAAETLAAAGGLAEYPVSPAEARRGGLPPFPAHDHLGGLYLLAMQAVPPGQSAWARGVVGRLNRFYDSCPAKWRQAEDPVLLGRLAHFQEMLDG